MKLNKLLMVALAGMTMFSCSNNDEMDNGLSNKGEKKAVVLRLDGVSTPKSRSVIDKETEADGAGENKHTMFLHSVNIYFCGAAGDGDIYQVATAAAFKTGDAQTLWQNLTGINGATPVGHTFDVPSGVEQVVVVGNPSDAFNSIQAGSTLADLKNVVLALEKENTAKTKEDLGSTDDLSDKTTKNNATLYGDATLVSAGETTEGSTTIYTYKADVEIRPLISRIEVKGFTCKFIDPATTGTPAAPHRFKAIKITGIGMVDYYSSMSVAGTVEEANWMFRNTPQEGGDGTNGGNIYKAEYEQEPTTGYKFCDASNETWNWAYDTKKDETTNLGIEFEIPTETTPDYSQPVNPKDGTDCKFAYNFFVPLTADNKQFPNIVIMAVGQGDNDENYQDANKYVATTSWGNAVLDRGKIYQFTYAFSEDNLGDWDTKDLKKVLVTVTAIPWEIVPVEPDIN